MAYDSRAVQPGNVFVALTGLHADGASFAQQAIERGAAGRGVRATAARRSSACPGWSWTTRGSRWRGSPPPSIGIRAPRCRWSASPARTARRRPRISWPPSSKRRRIPLRHPRHGRVQDRRRAASRHAHDARGSRGPGSAARDGDGGCGACAMEVSSHALSLGRVDGITFAAGVFTNLTRDHLDFHADMEAYFRAKRRLFEMLPRDAPSLINVDDPRGRGADRDGRPPGDLRRRSRRRYHAGAAVVFARRSGVRHSHATRADPGALVAGRSTERLQHPRRGFGRRRRSACRSTRSNEASSRCRACPDDSSSCRTPGTK